MILITSAGGATSKGLIYKNDMNSEQTLPVPLPKGTKYSLNGGQVITLAAPLSANSLTIPVGQSVTVEYPTTVQLATDI